MGYRRGKHAAVVRSTVQDVQSCLDYLAVTVSQRSEHCTTASTGKLNATPAGAYH